MEMSAVNTKSLKKKDLKSEPQLNTQFKCAYDELVELHKLQPNPRNPNQHDKQQIDMLAKIIDYQGQRRPIIVSNRSGFIVCGHGRLEALKKLGWEKAAVDYQDYSNEAEENADMIADNKIAELAESDPNIINSLALEMPEGFDFDLLGIPDFELARVEQVPQCDEDEVPEQVPTVSVLGDLYELGQHRLLCGNSTSIDAVEKLMNGEKADMVFTDPPYGVSVVKSEMVGVNFGVAKKGKYKEIIGDDTTDTARQFYQTCISAGMDKFILWGGNYFTDFLTPSKSWVIWNKRGDTDIQNTFADGEMAWSNLGHPVRIHGQLWNGMIRAGEKDKRVHPTQKPIALAEFCFDLLKDNQSIYDGFGGSGSTLIACEKTNRKCYMMELDPHYVDVIVSRWCKYTGKTKVIRNGQEMKWEMPI